MQDAVAAGLAAVVAEYRQAVAGFDADTRPGTVARAAERIRTTKYKVEAYAAYLADEREKLERDLAEAQAELRAKVAALAAPVPGAAPRP